MKAIYDCRKNGNFDGLTTRQKAALFQKKLGCLVDYLDFIRNLEEGKLRIEKKTMGKNVNKLLLTIK